MKANQSTQQKLITDVLLFASKNKMNKLDTIGMLEVTKLILYHNDENKALDDLALTGIFNNVEDVNQRFITNVLMSLTKYKFTKIDGIALIETTKLLVYDMDI